MRLIGLLIALTIIGLVTARQLSGPSGSPTEITTDSRQHGVPAVPQNLGQVADFKKQMKAFVDQHNTQQRQQLQQIDATN